jgi:hypothetical protein
VRGDGLPLTVFLLPAIGLGMGAFWLVFGRRLMMGADQRYRDLRVADLAPRLGLRIVEGDTALNMMQAHTKHNMRMAKDKAGFLRSSKETKVVLEGAPYGRPTRFLFHRYTAVAERVVVQVVSGAFDCRLSLQVPADLPPFEIVSRSGLGRRYMGIKAKAEWGLPPQPFGNADLDAKLARSCPDPRIGSYLAPVVGPLAGHRYVHIQGASRRDRVRRQPRGHGQQRRRLLPVDLRGGGPPARPRADGQRAGRPCPALT